MKRLTCTFAITIASLALPAAVQASYPSQGNFGLNSFDVGFRNEDGTTATQAGLHPSAMDLRLATNVDGEGRPEGWFR
ncbi:MAG TPA: hypothetical protein VF729_06020, partial [Solirubrobacterales bacterium]